MKQIYTLMLLVFVFVFSCTDEYEAFNGDSTPPGKLTVDRVVNKEGASVIYYTLPSDEDLLSVEASFEGQSGPVEVKVSSYVNSIEIRGFAEAKDYSVNLTVQDKSGNKSEPVAQTVSPTVPNYQTVFENSEIISDFGGALFRWDNPNQEEIIVTARTKDTADQYYVVQEVSSASIKGGFSVRGFDTIPTQFQIAMQDKYGNVSDYKEVTVTPLFETELDMENFKEGDFPDDKGDNPWGWTFSNMFNGTTGGGGYHTVAADDPNHHITIDLGVNSTVSRFIVHHRLGGFIYAHGNIKDFEVWVANDDVQKVAGYDGWTKLGTFHSYKPSGLPSGHNSEDAEFFSKGEEFIMPPGSHKAIRYLRINLLENWGGGRFLHIMEMQIFGETNE
jgi:hypothetical protein